ncbi:hypothetical protein GUI43_05353 [Micromonospora noduli]|nr:hypothetical protein GUI43_05353 [Micromonospora noduli]
MVGHHLGQHCGLHRQHQHVAVEFADDRVAHQGGDPLVGPVDLADHVGPDAADRYRVQRGGRCSGSGRRGRGRVGKHRRRWHHATRGRPGGRDGYGLVSGGRPGRRAGGSRDRRVGRRGVRGRCTGGRSGRPGDRSSRGGSALGRGRRLVDSPRRCGGRGVRRCRGGGSRDRGGLLWAYPWVVGRRGTGGGRRRVGAAHCEPAFHPLQALEQAAGGVVRAGQQHPGADQLQQQAGRGGAAHLDQPVVHDVGAAGQRGRAELRSLGCHPLDLVGRAVDETLRGGVRHLLDHDQVAEPLQQVGGEPAHVVPGLGDPVDGGVRGRAVTGGQRVAHLVDQRRVGDPEQRDGPGVADPLRAGAGDELVEHREAVPHAAATGADHQRKDRRLDGDALGLGELLQVRADHLRRKQPERVVVGPRPDRAEDLLRLGGGEDELDVLRGLLDQLEQGVEALGRDHVRLVDDVDLEAAAGRREEGALAQLAGVVDTAVAGRVDLDHVDRAGAVGGQRAAGVTLAARLGSGALLTVERAGHDPGAGGLAAATGAGEEVGVVEPSAAQRLRQRLGHVLLTDDLSEGTRPVLAVERQRHSSRLLSTEPFCAGRARVTTHHPGAPGPSGLIDSAIGLDRLGFLETAVSAWPGHRDITDAEWINRPTDKKASRAPGRARLSLLPSGPGEVHEIPPHGR